MEIMFNNKRGFSEVITSLIIILLVIVAIMVVWIVIRNVIDQGSEQISLSQFTIDLELERVVVNPTSIDVTVKRNAGQGELTGLKFIVSDGANSQAIDSSETLSELEQKTITLNYVGIVKSVAVAPVIKQGTTNSVRDISDTITYSSIETIESIPGLVSWWKFEGNANDEMGLNNGVISGATSTSGKYGNGYKFDGAGSMITVTDHTSLQISGPITLMAWIKPESSSGNAVQIVSKGDGFTTFPYALTMLSPSSHVYFLYNDGNPTVDTSNIASTPSNSIQTNNWNHLTGRFNGTTLSIYLNGNLRESKPKTALPGSLTGNLVIGNLESGGMGFNGTIDEVMIFNRSLSESEIQAVYNLDLSN